MNYSTYHMYVVVVVICVLVTHRCIPNIVVPDSVYIHIYRNYVENVCLLNFLSLFLFPFFHPHTHTSFFSDRSVLREYGN